MLTSLCSFARRFGQDESGAVTVDWVALTAGVVVVGLAVVWFIIEEGVNPLAVNIVESLTSIGGLIDAPDGPPTIGSGDGT